MQQHAIDLDAMEDELNKHRSNDLEDYAPKKMPVLVEPSPLPPYVVHAENVPEIGRLTAEVVVRDYEEAAKKIEMMGKELVEVQKQLEATVQSVHKALDEVDKVAARYRDEGKRAFERIEQCALLTNSVRQACEELQDRITKTAV